MYTDNFGQGDIDKELSAELNTVIIIPQKVYGVCWTERLVENSKFKWDTSVQALLPKLSHKDTRFSKETAR
ncbi:hypothetical protein N7463_009753 [Penicillium fimorum]|uniref:Uncharacterized protein n=1 Tax=Penicillium fimorum TaxID=1882269 RepID=A0A9W9XIK5_9EURO|nr:hypothetical protein N7463_009753 [Penicillium fimorum]